MIDKLAKIQVVRVVKEEIEDIKARNRRFGWGDNQDGDIRALERVLQKIKNL